MKGLELEDPDDSAKCDETVRLNKRISSSFHTNAEVPQTENSVRYNYIVLLAIAMVFFICISSGMVSSYEKGGMDHYTLKASHEDSALEKSEDSHEDKVSHKEKISHEVSALEQSEDSYADKVSHKEKASHEDSALEQSKEGVLSAKVESRKPKYSSKHEQNIENKQALYLHNETVSPFASELYEEYSLGSAEKEQEAFLEKIKIVREKYGAWNFYDDLKDKRPKVETYHKYPNRDVPTSTFPPNVWQSDENHMNFFLEESLALVRRVRTGIYEEYGFGSKPYDESELDELLGINFFEYPDYPLKNGRKGHYKVGGTGYTNGIAWMTQSGYDALVRKLLHTMMTNDDFYVVLAGHSAAAGHGNQFFQTKTMQFHYLMEPIFDRLGMNLITRNMALGGLGTVQNALGGAYIYGERDFLIWDSAMTEGNNDAHDVFIRHSLMSGERVPVVMIGGQDANSHSNVRKALQDAIGGFWHGDFHEPDGFIHLSDDVEDLNVLPYPSRGLKCEVQWDNCKLDRFASSCWIDRKDVKPSQTQSNKVPSQVGWHPGWRPHRWAARMWTILMLRALETALMQWGEKTASTGHPLADEHWHIGDNYDKIREAIKTSPVHNKKEETCENTIFSFIPRICRFPLLAATEFTPRADPESTSIRSIIVPAPNGYIPHLEHDAYNLYDGPNLLLPETKIPDGEVDVHAIAIASTDNKSRLRRYMRRHLGKEKETSRRNELQRIIQNQVPLNQRRQLYSIVPGRGWYLQRHPPGFCDGSAQSECNRGPNNDCLLYEHNDAHGVITGDAYSGWLVLQLEDMREGVIIVRMETWLGREKNPLTRDWKEENDGLTDDTSPYEFPNTALDLNENEENTRKLKGEPDPLPEELIFEVAINGEIKSVWNRDEFEEQRQNVAYNLDVFVLLDDPTMREKFKNKDDDVGETIEVAIRLKNIGREATFALSHVYWA